MLSSPGPKSRPRPPSQTRRPTGSTMPAPTSPARLRTQSHTPARARATTLTPAPLEPDVPPPPYTQDSTPTQRPNPRHSLTEIDDMLNVAGSVVRNRERGEFSQLSRPFPGQPSPFLSCSQRVCAVFVIRAGRSSPGLSLSTRGEQTHVRKTRSSPRPPAYITPHVYLLDLLLPGRALAPTYKPFIELVHVFGRI